MKSKTQLIFKEKKQINSRCYYRTRQVFTHHFIVPPLTSPIKFFPWTGMEIFVTNSCAQYKSKQYARERTQCAVFLAVYLVWSDFENL